MTMSNHMANEVHGLATGTTAATMQNDNQPQFSSANLNQSPDLVQVDVKSAAATEFGLSGTSSTLSTTIDTSASRRQFGDFPQSEPHQQPHSSSSSSRIPPQVDHFNSVTVIDTTHLGPHSSSPGVSDTINSPTLAAADLPISSDGNSTNRTTTDGNTIVKINGDNTRKQQQADLNPNPAKPLLSSSDEFDSELEEDCNSLNSSNNNLELSVTETTFSKDNSTCHHNNHPNNNSNQPNSPTRQIYSRLKNFGANLTNRISGSAGSTSTTLYTPFENTEDSAGATKYRARKQLGRRLGLKTGRTFRGNYRYSRINIVMGLVKRLVTFLFQKPTLAIFGSFLIHVTLGTIYTLSNVNSYLTSYMRLHGTPNATYGSSMWLTSFYTIGQGSSMILGGYIEKNFSARVACTLGCLIHSMSVLATSWTIDLGRIPVYITYGFLPGVGCGLAYMTPMSNGFGWFPSRKGLVAGFILAGFGIGTFIFNMAQTVYVNPDNLSPLPNANGYFTQDSILKNVPGLFIFLGSIYAVMQFIGCCLMFQPPRTADGETKLILNDYLDEDHESSSFYQAIRSKKFVVLFFVFGITNQGVLFINAMLKEYAQMFINDDLYLAWTGSMASIANSMGRLLWGLAIDKFTFTQTFTSITFIFGLMTFLMPFEFIISNKLLYLLCTLGIFGSFSGWMSTYPVHLSREFGTRISGMIYGLVFISQSIGSVATAFGSHYIIDNFNRFVPFVFVAILEVVGLAIYHLFYPR